jgi:hypothetical protein
MRNRDMTGREAARQRVDEVKHRLGERGPVWRTDGAPELYRPHRGEHTLQGLVYRFTRFSI